MVVFFVSREVRIFSGALEIFVGLMGFPAGCRIWTATH